MISSYMHYSSHYEGFRRRNIANRKNQGIAICLCLLYCVYALSLMDSSTQDYYPRYQPTADVDNIGKTPVSLSDQLLVSTPGDNQNGDEEAEHNQNQDEERDVNQNEDDDESHEEMITTYDAIIPPHVQLCSHLQPRLELAYKNLEAEMKAQELGIFNFGLNLDSIPELQVKEPRPDEIVYLVVEDDDRMCEEPKSTMEALLEIYSSTLLSETANRFKLNMEYRHNCHLDRLNRIQDMLGADLFGESIGLKKSTLIDISSMHNICKDCLKEDQLNSEKNCVLFSKPVSLQSQATGIEAIFPLMKQNLRFIAEKWKNEDQVMMLEKFAIQLHPSPSLPAVAYNITDQQNATINAIQDGPTTKPSASYVVYISCIEEDCNDIKDSIAVPFKFYYEHINHKDDITSVSIIISESCSAMVDGCLSYGQALYAMFTQHFSNAQIELIRTPSTYMIYSQIYLADYIVCPPSHACILPAMLSDGFALIALQDNEIISQWPKDLISSSKTIFVSNFKGKSVTKLDHKFLMSK